MEKISLAVQTLYADLLEMPEGLLPLAGSAYERELSGHRYLYCKQTVGKKRLDKYVGKVGEPSTEEARGIIEQANLFARMRREMVRMLKPKLPLHTSVVADVLSALQHFGMLRESRSVLVGTNAYICYSALVGFRLDNAAMGTQDADLATLDLLAEETSQSMSPEDMLRYADVSFRAVPSLSKKVLPASFISNIGFRVDLITQQRSRTPKETIPVQKLSAGAQPLQHVAWLIHAPARAVILSREGINVNVPQPARYAIHKLILAQKRQEVYRLKRMKDLAQAKSLISALRMSDPNGLQDAYEDACAQGEKGWAAPIRRSLKEIGEKL